MSGNFDWVKFYVDFADKLYDYKENRGPLVQILSKAFNDKDKENFNRALEKNDIDPFTIFASFNSFSGKNRNDYINRFIKAFEMDGSIIPNSFDGVPSAQPQQKRYYNHDSSDILTEVQNLWDLFVYSINYANDKTDENERLFCEAFDTVKRIRGVGLSKLTAALFWIRPNDFMTLDANSFAFLKREYRIVDSDQIDGKDYLRILEECDNICKNGNTDFKNFPKLSHFAYCASKKEIKIWKISHGILSLEERNKLKERNAISMSKDTAALARSNETQGGLFEKSVNKGDYFYLCYGSEIVLVGKITSDAPIRNVDKTDDWIEYTYEKICDSKSSSNYNGKKKWWTPNYNSTFYEVTDQKQFEEWILKPYFDMHLSDLTESQIDKRKDGNHMNKNISDINLNTILYGPPGTGKTYNTALYAVAICDPKKSLKELEEQAKKDGGYEEILNTYNTLLKQERIAFTTFHQSYGYEDFIEGIKPDTRDTNTVSYKTEPGVFKKFCETSFESLWEQFVSSAKANNNQITISRSNGSRVLEWNEDHNKFYDTSTESLSYQYADFNSVKKAFDGNYEKNEKSGSGMQKYYNSVAIAEILKENMKAPKVFIIDEINRGNVSKIFGELITLIEEEKRGKHKAKLPYSQSEFTVPENVYILGTMNTADRSLALMDTALRRRFDFIEMLPNADLFKGITVQNEDNAAEVKIDKLLETINKRIEYLYDREHTIGHAYFKELLQEENRNMDTLRKIFIKKIIPLLQEYFYDDYKRIRLVLGDNRPDINGECFIQECSAVNNLFFGNEDIDWESITYSVNKDIKDFSAERFKKIYE